MLNCSLKNSESVSNTQALMDEVTKIYDLEDVETEVVRVADYKVAYGVTEDEGDGDEWPQIFEKVKQADIVIIGTPIWLGVKSSIATLTIERLYGGSGLTNDKGQSIYFNKVGGVVSTGNEDGAKEVSRDIIYALSHIGFTIPPNVDTYWVGEAGPGPSFIEAEGNKNAFTQSHVNWLAYNTIHFARMLKTTPIPAVGNLLK